MNTHSSSPSLHHDVTENTVFGFWVYLMTDFILFATLFATYAVLRTATFGGPAGRDIFQMPVVLGETLLLLLSTFSCSMAKQALFKEERKKLTIWYGVTFILGAIFLALMMSDLRSLVQEGNSWQRSAFLSAYFTLVGTHGLHIFFGLLFMIVFLIQFAKWGFTPMTIRRLTCLNIFWFFSYVVWIFMFTMVYLMEMI